LDYDDFWLHFATDGRDGFQVAARSGRGEAAAAFVPPAALASGKHLGAQLFEAVMSPSVRSLFDESIAAGETVGRGLRVRLLFNRREPRLASLSQLPWELMYRADREAFLALDTATPIVRHLAVPQPNRLAPLASPLRVLIAAAGAPDLAVANECRALAELAEASVHLALKLVERPTLGLLRRALVAPLDVFHFIGHGGFDGATGQGYLVLDRDEMPSSTGRDLSSSDGPAGEHAAHGEGEGYLPHRAQGAPVRGEVLANLLTGREKPRLAVLNACSTARAAGAEGLPPFGGIAAALVLGGVPAVVAMQRPIEDRAACELSVALYERIAAGASLEEAVAEARRAVYAACPSSFDWAIPALFLRLEDGRLFARTAERPQQEPPQPSPPSMPPAVNLIELKVENARGPVDLCGAEGDAPAGGDGENNRVVATIGTAEGPISASARRRNRAERHDG
jgi:hypothetical protein